MKNWDWILEQLDDRGADCEYIAERLRDTNYGTVRQNADIFERRLVKVREELRHLVKLAARFDDAA